MLTAEKGSGSEGTHSVYKKPPTQTVQMKNESLLQRLRTRSCNPRFGVEDGRPNRRNSKLGAAPAGAGGEGARVPRQALGNMVAAPHCSLETRGERLNANRKSSQGGLGRLHGVK